LFFPKNKYILKGLSGISDSMFNYISGLSGSRYYFLLLGRLRWRSRNRPFSVISSLSVSFTKTILPVRGVTCGFFSSCLIDLFFSFLFNLIIGGKEM